jgi:hypothetical protein
VLCEDAYMCLCVNVSAGVLGCMNVCVLAFVLVQEDGRVYDCMSSMCDV